MSRLRTAGVVLLVLVLAVDIAAASALVAVDRTVLNPDFVTTTLEEENAYQHAEPIVLEQLPLEELGGEGGEAPPLPVDPRTVASEALDPAYLQSQVEPNIERTYAYLHGREDQLELAVNLEPAKTAIVDAVEAELTNASTAELFETVAAQGEGLSFEVRGFTLDLVTVAEMAENRSTFRSEREELRATVRDRVLTQLVDEAFAEASNDQLLRLVIDDYDPDEYTESEKEQLVDDNEAEIRAALRERIEAERGDEVDAAVDDRLAETRDAIRSNVSTAANESLGDVPPAVAEPMTDLLLVAVDGYVADVTYDEFSAEFESAADEVAGGVATLLGAEIDQQVPDRIDLDEQLDSGAVEGLEEARRAVGLIDLLAAALPIAAAAIIGLIFLLTRSVATTAMGGGLGLALGGLPTLAGASQVRPRLQTLLAGGELPAEVQELVLALAGRVTEAVLLQSGVVVGLGVVAFAAGLAVHRGLIELPVGAEPE